jgi:hypothetical protein
MSRIEGKPLGSGIAVVELQRGEVAPVATR